MLRAAFRDLQWRWKRFVIAMVGVALVFAMGLIMTGLPRRSRPRSTARSTRSVPSVGRSLRTRPGRSTRSARFRRAEASNIGGSSADGASRNDSGRFDRSRRHRDGSRAGRSRLSEGVSAGGALTARVRSWWIGVLPGASVGDDDLVRWSSISESSARFQVRACSPEFLWCTSRWQMLKPSPWRVSRLPPRCSSPRSPRSYPPS